MINNINESVLNGILNSSNSHNNPLNILNEDTSIFGNTDNIKTTMLSIDDDIKEEIEKFKNTLNNIGEKIEGFISNTVDSIKNFVSGIKTGFINLIKPANNNNKTTEDKTADNSTIQRDGIISNTKQGSQGDCWLLSSVNTLSYTKAGKEIIKETLEYKDDKTIVHFKGIGDYEITNEELTQAKKRTYEEKSYSKGDDDMVILEMAMEKAYNDIANSKVVLKTGEDATAFESAKSLREDIKQNDSAIYAGYTAQGLYILTGKQAEFTQDKQDFENYLNNFKNSQNKTLNAGISKLNDNDSTTFELNDINNNKITLARPHAYAIKEATDDYISVINPWDSSKEIKLDKETFLNTFTDMTLCDLSDNNPSKNITQKTQTDENGNIYTLEKCNSETYNMLKRGNENYSKVKYIYSENEKEANPILGNGNISQTIYYDENDNAKYKIEYKDNNEIYTTYEQNGRFELKYSNKGMSVIEKDTNGNVINSAEFSTFKEILNMYNYGLFDESDLNLEDMVKLSQSDILS